MYACELARGMTRIMLESYDDELAASRDTGQYRDKGRRGTSIKTVYGEVEYRRRVYRTIQEILRKIGDRRAQREIRALLEEGRPDEALEYIEAYATSVEGQYGEEGKSEKARELYKYLNNNREGLLPYDRRGIRIPEAREGVVYKGMGVQENQNCTTIMMRMKHERMRWSQKGANNLAKAPYRKENGELSETIDRYADGLAVGMQMKEILETSSAAKAPKRDGKGNPYTDAISIHMPLREAMQTASRKAFLGIFS